VTDRRTVPADVVVWCAPVRPPSLPRVRMLPVIPASRTFVSVDADAPAIADELMVHTSPPMRIFAAGERRWTIEHHAGEDPLEALARVGLDLRRHVTSRSTLGPGELVGLGHWGWTWSTWTTAFDVPGVAPTGGLYFAGAHAHPGGTLEAIGMATAAIAADVGPVAR
jgi:phytoene dehydrogenase-like protein